MTTIRASARALGARRETTPHRALCAARLDERRSVSISIEARATRVGASSLYL